MRVRCYFKSDVTAEVNCMATKRLFYDCNHLKFRNFCNVSNNKKLMIDKVNGDAIILVDQLFLVAPGFLDRQHRQQYCCPCSKVARFHSFRVGSAMVLKTFAGVCSYSTMAIHWDVYRYLESMAKLLHE